MSLLFTCSCWHLALLGLLILSSLVAASEARHVNIRPDTITVSGISAGAFMAVQYETAFSSTIRGAAIVAGGPYMCAMDDLDIALTCMNAPFLMQASTFEALAAAAADAGEIDGIGNISAHTVRLFSGTQDSVVNPVAMQLLKQTYELLGTTDLNTTFDIPAAHAWITATWGASCSTFGSPFINNCGIDFVGNFLRDALTSLGVAWNNTRGEAVRSSLYRFDQLAFGASPLINSLSNTGFMYAPTRCLQVPGSTSTDSSQGSGSSGAAEIGSCHLHINFHGCEQDADEIGDVYVRHAEINGWAESNGIIVVYPQVTANDLLTNPNACFDWWGYTDSNYAYQSGTQMAVVRAIERSLVDRHILPSPVMPPNPVPSTNCTAKPSGATCLSPYNYIYCPEALVYQCVDGFLCVGLPGLAACV